MSRSAVGIGLLVFAAGCATLLLREPWWFVIAIATLSLGASAVVGVLLLNALVRREPRA